ncbi:MULTISPECIES: hypothetical protein [unclassified Bradyrhizobium]|uniref:hypothetical protein n=1 Tax=unclassified Bradyrhizobium TaxID=2631580 RepID=UPI002916151F|nr:MULTISPECIES: hypothetical protein [unclassified Bradyrhizobium]
MERNNLPGLTPVWIIALATVLAAFLSAGVPFIFKDDIRPADWLGFAGNIIVAGVALIAAVIAWRAVQAQIAAPDEARVKAQAEAKSIAVVALAQPVHAASALLRAVQIAEAANTDAGKTQWDGIVAICCEQVSAMLDHFALREISGELDPNDRALFLIIILQLSSMINIYRRPFGLISREQALKNFANQLRGLENYLPHFDQELWDVFVRDSNPAAAHQ